ncbi:MAG TPA: hypothetical protein VF745_14565 [Steroidobacteraceae bacterium]
MKHANPFLELLRTLATLAAIVAGLAIAVGLAWLGSNHFDTRLTPAAKALLAPRHDPLAPSGNIFVALVGFDATAAGAEHAGASRAAHLTLQGIGQFRPWFISSMWQTAKKHRTQIAALIASNRELYQRYLDMQQLQGYFDSAPPGSYRRYFLLPHQVQELFLAEVAEKIQTGMPAQQEAALAALRRDMRMWRTVLHGYGGLASKIMAAISLRADFDLLADMVTDPDFHPALPGSGMESAVTPFPLQDWKIGDAYGWEMRNSAALLEAMARPATRPDRSDASIGNRISAQLFKLHATENLEADLMQRLSALADGSPGNFIERRDAYRKWESREFAFRTSWYNPVGRMILANAAGAHEDDYPARVLDIAAFQRLVCLAYQIRRRGLGAEDIPAFMKQHPEWSTHPVDAKPFFWNPANGTLGFQPIGREVRSARFSLKLVAGVLMAGPRTTR